MSLKDSKLILGTDNYKFACFGSYGPSSDTSVRMFDKTSILDWLSTAGWTSATRMLDGVTGASANNMAATYNFEARIVLACGGQQASIGIGSSMH